MNGYDRNMRNNFPDTLVLIKGGNFYRCYNDDSIIIAYLMDYKVKTTIMNDMAGFPVDSLRRVVDKIQDKKISYKIFGFENKIPKLVEEFNFEEENQYDEIYQKAERYVRIREEISIIADILYSKIEEENIEEKIEKIKGIID